MTRSRCVPSDEGEPGLFIDFRSAALSHARALPRSTPAPRGLLLYFHLLSLCHPRLLLPSRSPLPSASVLRFVGALRGSQTNTPPPFTPSPSSAAPSKCTHTHTCADGSMRSRSFAQHPPALRPGSNRLPKELAPSTGVSRLTTMWILIVTSGSSGFLLSLLILYCFVI